MRMAPRLTLNPSRLLLPTRLIHKSFRRFQRWACPRSPTRLARTRKLAPTTTKVRRPPPICKLNGSNSSMRHWWAWVIPVLAMNSLTESIVSCKNGWCAIHRTCRSLRRRSRLIKCQQRRRGATSRRKIAAMVAIRHRSTFCPRDQPSHQSGPPLITTTQGSRWAKWAIRAPQSTIKWQTPVTTGSWARRTTSRNKMLDR